MSRESTCCFTGHRTIDENEFMEISYAVTQSIKELIKKGYHCFVTGGSTGFDTFVALTILSLKSEYPMIRLVVVAPFEGQPIKWSNKDQQVYEYIKDKSDDFIVLRMGYIRGCMMERNRYMVNMSSVCIGFCEHTPSGSASTLAYAKRQGLTVVNIAEHNNQMSLFNMIK